MTSKEAVGYLALVVVAFAVWFVVKRMFPQAIAVPSVVTNDAGMETPVASMSNTPDLDGRTWMTPYYLRSNYPTERDATAIIPSYVRFSLPANYGPQEIPPQL